MRVNVEDIRELKRQLSEINKLDFDQLEFYEDGKLVELDQEMVDKFIFMGLNNTDFIMTGYYKEKSSK